MVSSVSVTTGRLIGNELDTESVGTMEPTLRGGGGAYGSNLIASVDSWSWPGREV